MTVSATLKASVQGAGSALTTGSFTTTTGKYYLMCYRNGVASGYPTSVSTTAGTLTFSTINSATSGALAIRMYGGYCTAGGTGTATANLNSSSNTSFCIIELGGITASGAVVQSVNATGSSTTLSSTLSAFSNANNATLIMAGAITATTPTPDAGFTALYTDGTPNIKNATYFNVGTDTTPSATLSPTSVWATVAIEIAALRADTLTHYPTAVSTTGGSTSWSNTSNVYLSDNSYATVVPDATASNNTYIDVTGFNMSYPAAATPVMITVDVEAKSSGNSQLESVQLLKAGSPVGTVYSPATTLTSSDAFYTPASADLWGTTWTASEVSASGFGARLRFKANTNQNDTGDFPNGFTNTITSAGGSISWANPTNANAYDTTYTTQTAPSATASSNDYLKFSNFGFNLPSNATVVGIWAYVSRRRNGGTTGDIRTETFQLTKAGTLVGTNNAATGTNWPTTQADEFIDSGIGVSNLWGTTWTYSDINNTGFGFWYRVNQVDSSTSTSATFSTSAADQANASIAWVNPSNANASDSTYATQTAPGSSANTAANYNYLYLSSYGFSIPSNATITGVTASIRRLRNGGSTGAMRFDTVQLLKGGTPTGTNLATATNFPTTVAAVSFGGTTNMWGNTLSYTDVNASNFGLAIRLVGSTAGTNRVGNIDSASLTITYTTHGDRNAQVDAGQLGVYYSTTDTGTVSLDTVRINVTATGVVTANSSITEAVAQTYTRVNRSRNVTTAIDETLALAFNLTITQPYKFFDFTITEATSYVESLSRLRKILFTNIEAETFATTLLKKTRRVASTINESETVSAAKIQRLRNITLSVIEADALAIAIDRARHVNTTINEIETLIFNLLKLKGLTASIAEVEAFAASIKRARHEVTSVAEVIAETFTIDRSRHINYSVSESETVSSNVKRARHVSTSIAETESVTGALSRLKHIAFSLAEAFNYTFDFNKFKSLTTTINEIDTFSFGALRRARHVNSAIHEVLTYAENLSRNRHFVFTDAQIETINASIKKAIKVVTTIQETYGSTDKLSRARHVNTTINEIETLTISKLARLKHLAFVCSETSNHQFWMRRARKLNPQTIAETESLQVNFNRARAFVAPINETESCTINFGRLRKQIVSINETQTATAALSRLREILTTITETTGYEFDVRVVVGDPAVINVLITYQKWVNTSTSVTDSVINLATFTEALSFTNKTSSVSNFRYQTSSTSNFRNETSSVVEVDTLTNTNINLENGTF